MKYTDSNTWAADRYADKMDDWAELEELKEQWEEEGGLDVLEHEMREEDGIIELMENAEFLDRIVNFCLADAEMVEHLKGIHYYRYLLDVAFEGHVEGLKDFY